MYTSLSDHSSKNAEIFIVTEEQLAIWTNYIPMRLPKTCLDQVIAHVLFAERRCRLWIQAWMRIIQKQRPTEAITSKIWISPRNYPVGIYSTFTACVAGWRDSKPVLHGKWETASIHAHCIHLLLCAVAALCWQKQTIQTKLSLKTNHHKHLRHHHKHSSLITINHHSNPLCNPYSTTCLFPLAPLNKQTHLHP